MKKNFSSILLVAFSMFYLGFLIYRNKTEFPTLFEKYDYTYCLTTGYSSNTKWGGHIIRYEYNVGGEIFKGHYTVDEIKSYKIPGGKYLVVYSERDPSYNVLFEIEVTPEKINQIKITREELKKRFDINNRAKRKNGRKKNNEVPTVNVPDIIVKPE